MRGTNGRSVIGYVRVSTDRQADSGAGLTVQRQAIEAHCKRQRWNLTEIVSDDGESAATLSRPGIARALAQLAAGEVRGLVVAKQDRLSRSVRDLQDLIELSARQGWGLVIRDSKVDTTTPVGEAMALNQSVFSQLERKLISQRTKDALAVKKAEGVQLGRPLSLNPETRTLMRRHRRSGKSYGKIARMLNDHNVPTAQGGKTWHPNTVRAALNLKR